MDRTAALYQQVREVTGRIKDLQRQVNASSRERRDLVTELRAAGEPVEAIARSMGCTRAAVYGWLGYRPPRREDDEAPDR